MATFKAYTITDKSYVKQISGDYHYLDRSESGQFVVKHLESGSDFFIAHATNEAETEWVAIFASLENANRRDAFVSGRISFYELASTSDCILIAKMNPDLEEIYHPTKSSIRDIGNYKEHLDYKENYRETKEINDRFLSTISGHATKTSA